MGLDCISILAPGTMFSQPSFFKSLTSKILNLLSSIMNKGKEHNLVISGCFNYLSCLLRVFLTEELTAEHNSIVKEVNSKDVASLATHFITSMISSRLPKISDQTLLFLQTGCQLLFLWAQGSENSPSFLLNSTSLLLTIFQIV